MEKDLDDILSKQAQLKAMEQSLHEFAEQLKKMQDEFLIKHLGVSKDEKNVSWFELLKRSKKSRLIV